jgi:protein-tyrosine-phosphatase
MQEEVRWLKAFLESMHLMVLAVSGAGTKPTSQINPLAIQAMNEVGIDISRQKPKEITEDMMRNSTKIVNMGCMDDKYSCNRSNHFSNSRSLFQSKYTLYLVLISKVQEGR